MAEMKGSKDGGTQKKLDKILEAQKSVLENIDELIQESNIENEKELLGDDNIDETNMIGKFLAHNQILFFSHRLY
mgnify:CR=1 FL=1|jgi:hypothetical protein